MNDFEVLYMIHHQDDYAIEMMLESAMKLIWSNIHAICNELQPKRVSKADLFQEGCIGLLDAINAYREDYNVPFLPFAKVCIVREIRSLLRRHRGMNYGIIDQSVSLDMAVSEDHSLYLSDIIADPCKDNNPTWMALKEEVKDYVYSTKVKLNDTDRSVYELRNNGFTYQEISEILNIKAKSVDNSIQKITKKLTMLFD